MIQNAAPERFGAAFFISGARMQIVSIDPGLHCAGVALWDGMRGSLEWAGLVQADAAAQARAALSDFQRSQAAGFPMLARAVYGRIVPRLRETPRIVIEVPQVYDRRKSVGDPNDLINLAFMAGLIIGALPTDNVTVVRPAEWGGQVQKAIKNSRAVDSLSTEEKARIEIPKAAGTLLHNVLDAVGIGLWYLRRSGLRRG